MSDDEVLDRTDMVGLAGLVRAGDVTPGELLDVVARRVEERNPVLNAVIATRIDAARAEIAAGLQDGALRGIPFGVKDMLCDVAGLATTAGCRLFTDAVAGPAPGDPYGALPAPPAGTFLAGLDRPPGQLRIGVATTLADGDPACPAAAAAVQRTAALLSGLGHQVSKAAPQWDPVAASTSSAALMITFARVQVGGRLTALGRDLADDDIEPFTRFLLDTTDPTAIFTHRPEMTSFTSVFNATGLPAASVPAGFDESGLPVGVQLAGPMGAEDVLLRLARQLEQAAPWPWQAWL